MTTRVAIVDDSPFIREVLRTCLRSHPDIEIVGEAGDGRSAEQLVFAKRPDVVTMDVMMPLVSGLEAIRNIMARAPTPIVVLSDARGGVDRLVIEAVAAGAIDVFKKPTTGFDDKNTAELANVLRSAARTKFPAPPPARKPERLGIDDAARRLASATMIGIASSTGGPGVLHQIIHGLPRGFSVPIAIVQHTATGFTHALVSWLGEGAPVRVSVAQAGETVRGVVIAPDEHHLEINARKEIVLQRNPPVRGHRPSGSVLLQSLASHGRGAVGIVCTGMSDDGASGLAALEAAGGVAIVEDPQSALIDSMPRAAVAATREPVVATVPRIVELLRHAGKHA